MNYLYSLFCSLMLLAVGCSSGRPKDARLLDLSEYDDLGNPHKIFYKDGGSTQYVYSVRGEKLKTTHSSPIKDVGSLMSEADTMSSAMEGEDASASGVSPQAPGMALTTIEYHGNVIYRDGKVDMVLFPGGYATINGTAVTFHYYTQDYLGNNRAVINGSTGAVEQSIAYYPYGAVIATLGTPTTGQPFKFGGKELVTANGRIDMLIETPKYIYAIELKYDGTPEEALRHLGRDARLVRPRADPHRLFRIGANFSSESRRIEGWKIEE